MTSKTEGKMLGFVQRACIIIRNVIALLLLKGRGRRGGGGWRGGGLGDQAQRYKVRAKH